MTKAAPRGEGRDKGAKKKKKKKKKRIQPIEAEQTDGEPKEAKDEDEAAVSVETIDLTVDQVSGSCEVSISLRKDIAVTIELRTHFKTPNTAKATLFRGIVAPSLLIKMVRAKGGSLGDSLCDTITRLKTVVKPRAKGACEDTAAVTKYEMCDIVAGRGTSRNNHCKYANESESVMLIQCDHVAAKIAR